MSKASSAIFTVIGILMAAAITASFIFFSIYFMGPKPDPPVIDVSRCDTWNTSQPYSLVDNGTYVALGRDLNAYMMRPLCTNRDAAILIIHDIRGWEMEGFSGIMRDLALNGYTSLAPNLFRTGQDNFKLAVQNRSMVQADLFSTVRYMKRVLRYNRVDVIGFEWGGTKTAEFCGVYHPSISVESCVSFDGIDITPLMALATFEPTLFIAEANGTGDAIVNQLRSIETILRAANRFLDHNEEDSWLHGSPVGIEVIENATRAYDYSWENPAYYEQRNETSPYREKRVSKEAWDFMYLWLDR